MKTFSLLLIALLVLTATPALAKELLSGDEQDFETSITPGRWQEFTWPCVWETCPGPGGTTCVTGVQHPTVIGGCTEGPDGYPVDYLHWDDNAPGRSGSKCVGIYDTGDPGWGAWANVGGIMITVPAVNGATHTISGYVKFATDTSSETGWRSAAGITVDTDGGTDPGAAEYGWSYNGAIQEGDLLQGNGNPADPSGDCIWNQEGFGAGDAPEGNEGVWWEPTQFKLDIQATGNQITVFFWGLNKFRSNIVLFDGISIQDPLPEPTATPLPASTEGWHVYR